jgi:hypothetical protein
MTADRPCQIGSQDAASLQPTCSYGSIFVKEALVQWNCSRFADYRPGRVPNGTMIPNAQDYRDNSGLRLGDKSSDCEYVLLTLGTTAGLLGSSEPGCSS